MRAVSRVDLRSLMSDDQNAARLRSILWDSIRGREGGHLQSVSVAQVAAMPCENHIRTPYGV